MSEQAREYLPEQVERLAGQVAAGRVSKREAVDELVARWELTRVGALDLLNKERGVTVNFRNEGESPHGWVRLASRDDLGLMHHALRMLATHPMTTDQREISSLADACWDEIVRRDSTLPQQVSRP